MIPAICANSGEFNEISRQGILRKVDTKAVQTHLDLEVRQSIAMLFLTFQLTTEAITDPVTALEEALGAQIVPNMRFRTLGNIPFWGYCRVPNGSTINMTRRIEDQIERFAPGFDWRILLFWPRFECKHCPQSEPGAQASSETTTATLARVVFRRRPPLHR